MSRTLNNKLVGQVGEHLLSAKLGMMGFYASPFAGNVPTFDVTAVDAETLRSKIIQVKTSTTNTLAQSEISTWIETNVDDTGLYSFGEKRKLIHPKMIWVLINLPSKDLGSARFFICTEKDIQEAHINRFTTWIESHGYRRPKLGNSMHSILTITELSKFEDNWALITKH
ncbi:hypothetical protein LJ739_01975 [Aestuariibacter halophilus]|uniref:DUF4365 domain-containing protein n=1 Tax=Fluctibacter halophilus TaxID=226011 RepID=A0ABS8G3E8_9ALTE|nr:hypothetical protein [Aestuariibacter halophilus]MCC2615008.1 hypothetical protein [Aestuariibacter halophilus]